MKALHSSCDIYFSDSGFRIRLPDDADPECAIKTAELIIKGNSHVIFEVPGRCKNDQVKNDV